MSGDESGRGMEADEDVAAEGEGEGEGESASIPQSLKALRACKRCMLVKTTDQFYNEGCENCPFLYMKDDTERVNDCTSAYFTGLISMIEPRGSWVARWQRISNCKPGMYAVEVVGDFPKDIREQLEEDQVEWRAKPA